ncbi:MAG: hypothetical protein RLY61_829 [Candidatus Parcubacteria bacterium]|jgi:hypothetical protein
MSEIKTKQTTASVTDFLNSVQDKTKREDAFILLDIFQKITNEPAKMWGSSMVGFGTYHYKSERSSQEGDWLITGFSPRKNALTLYILAGEKQTTDLLSKLGKHTTGVGCLYIKRLSDVNLSILKQLIKENYNLAKSRNKK